RLEVPSPGVLVDTSDANGDVVKAILIQPPSHGVLDLREDGSFTYIPESGFIGIDVFVAQAFDGEMFSYGQYWVALQVISAAPPSIVATPDYYATAVDDPLLGDVLDNDYEPNGQILRAELVTGPKNGTVDLRADGKFTYRPSAGFIGTDNF